jgi:hypothetical protein
MGLITITRLMCSFTLYVCQLFIGQVTQLHFDLGIGRLSAQAAGVWLLNNLFTTIALVFAANTGPLVDVNALPTSLQWLKLFGPDLGFFTVVFYSVYYLFLDPVAAVSFKVILEETEAWDQFAWV